MNASVKTKDLLNACAFAAGALKARTTMAALHHIRLTAAKGEISAFGSNLEIFKTQYCPADVKTGFDVGLPGSLLIAFLRSISADQVELTVSKDSTRLKAGSVEATIQHLSGKEFPALPKVKGDEFTVPADLLQKKLKQVIHSADTNIEAWRLRCAVYFQFFDSALNLTAFDGKSMATTRIGGAQGKGEFIVPTELVREIISIDEPGDITITLADHALFSGEGWELRGKLIDGSIIDWRQAEKNYTFSKFATVQRDPLIDSLRRILIFTPTNPSLNNATQVEIANGRLNLSLKRHNSVQEALECSGGDITTSIDPEAVLRAVSEIESDTVKIGLIDQLSPLQITDGDYRVLTMPYRQ